MFVSVDNPECKNIGIGKILSGKYCCTFVDVIFAGIFYDVLRNFLFISKYSLVVFESCQITVDHLGVIPHAYLLRQNNSTFSNKNMFRFFYLLTANLLAVAILFSTLLSIASLMSFNKDIS